VHFSFPTVTLLIVRSPLLPDYIVACYANILRLADHYSDRTRFNHLKRKFLRFFFNCIVFRL
jgi:hypothetical protein